MAGLKWIIVAELLLDSGSEYVSGERVRRGAFAYLGTVLNWGTIDRSIPQPCGMPHVSDAHVRIADPFRKWRDLSIDQTWRRRLMQLTLMPEGASIAAYPPCFIGEIVDVTFPPASIEITLRDRTFQWLDEPIPSLVSLEFFDYVLPVDEGKFLPIVNGNMLSVPLPHMGQVDGIDRWGVAMHPVDSLVMVYRWEQIDVDGNRAWVEVDSAEYIVTLGSLTAFGVDITPTFLDFLVVQPEGTEIMADIDGINFRGTWGPLAEIGRNETASPPYGDSVVLRNPIDFFINMTYLIMAKAGLSTDAFDTTDIAALREAMDDVYFCDGAITEPLSAREFLGRFLTSFNLDMFAKRNGKITLTFTDATDAERPVFKEGKHVLLESFAERIPSEISNLIVARSAYNHTAGKFDTEIILTISDSANTTEKEILDFYFVSDAATVEAIALLRNRSLSLGSFRQTFTMPAPAVLDDLELAKLVGLTHSMGLGVGGYTNRELKVTGLSLNLDTLEMTVDSILRVPQAIVPSPRVTMTGEGTLEALNLGSGLVLWLEADSLALNDGDPVSSWLDLSGNGNDAAQATSGNRPIFKTGILNGYPVVRFDGVDDFMACADSASLDVTQLHIFIVAKVTSLTTNPTMISKPANADWTTPYARYYFGFQASSGKAILYNCNYENGQLLSTSNPDTSNFVLYESRYDGTTQVMYFDNVAENSNTPGQGAIPNSAYALAIGTANTLDPQQPFVGDIAAIIMFNLGNMDAADWHAVQDYLNDKYGLY